MNKTAVITGGNRGIGLELVKCLIKHHYQVYVICRKVSKELKKTNATVITDVDITNKEDIKKAILKLKSIKIDLLINNAGILTNETLDNLNDSATERIMTQFETNALAPLIITNALKKKLNPGSKVIMITSRMGSITDNSSGSRYGYRMSKAALNIASKSLAIDLEKENISVGILHPGWVQTDMTGHSGMISASESASMLYERIQDVNIKTTGTFVHANGEKLPW